MTDTQMDAAPHRPAQDDELSPVPLAPAATTPSAPISRLGDRLRSLRLAAGLTQTQVGGDRFSKEYISQIERGMLNWRLLQAPPHIINYVICHELAHLKQMNHSAKFWAVVEQLFPNYKTAEKELKALSAQLHRL